MANGKCRIHGGLTPAGPLSANYKHGLYSKYLPARYAGLLAALEGSDLLDLTDEIRLLKAGVIEKVCRLSAGESGELWRQARNAFQAFASSQAKQDREGALTALTELRRILNEGVADWEVVEKVEDSAVKLMKVVESQRKRAVEANEMLAAQDAREILRSMAEGLKHAVEEIVDDPELRRRIFTAASSEFARRVNPGRVELVSSANN